MTGQRASIGLLLSIFLAAPAAGEELAVIVNVERTTELTVDEVARIYLKQRRFWDNGERIVPVNRDSSSSERERFVRAVFGVEVRQLQFYWNREYFNGVLPPATLASDEAVKRFVASERLAIGYVHPDALDDSVRVVLRLGD